MATKADYNKVLTEETDNKKKEWAENIKDLAPMIRSKNVHDMTEASALGLSYRVMILEEISYFLTELAQEQRGIKELKRDRFILYSTGLLPDGTRPTGNILNHPLIGNTRITGSQKEMVISGDLADFEHTIEILTQTVEMFREYVKTIDSYMFAIKNRLEILAILK